MSYKNILILIFTIISLSLQAQYFTGGFINNGNQLTFKIKANGGNINESITYIEFNIRYATNLDITFSNLVSNVANFPGLDIQAAVEREFDSKKYQRFVYNTGTIPAFTYLQGVEYDVFTVDLNDPIIASANIELATDLNAPFPNDYYLSINDAAGNLLTDYTSGNNDYFFPSQQSPGGSEFYTGLLAVPLPLDLISFNAKASKNSIELKWESIHEFNFNGFELQRSEDGESFNKIAFIEGKGQNTFQYYTYDDNSVLKNQLYFYRLKLIDNDAGFSYSEIKNAIIHEEESVQIYPNPTDGKFTISASKQELSELIIYNIHGEKILDFSKDNNIKTTFDINLFNLSSGVYIIKTKSNTYQVIKR